MGNEQSASHPSHATAALVVAGARTTPPPAPTASGSANGHTIASLPNSEIPKPVHRCTSESSSHPKVVKHRSLSPVKCVQTTAHPAVATGSKTPARMNRYRASFRHGLPPPNANGNAAPGFGSGASLTVNGVGDAVRTPRRTKSFRPGGLSRAAGSFRIPTCPITGLTPNQKLLITSKWKEMDRWTSLEFSRNVFETTFKRDPRFLRVIDLSSEVAAAVQQQQQSGSGSPGTAGVDDSPTGGGRPRFPDWRTHSHFRVHVQRFCDMLNDVIRFLDDPQQSLNSIREFGSWYASAPSSGCEPSSPKPHVPSSFWDTLIFALNNAAKDMQVETSSRSSESPTSLDRRFLLPTAHEDSAYLSSCAAHSSSAPHMRRLYNSNGSSPLTGYSSGTGSVCPRAAEAWNLLATFIVGQMRFAYELERVLQAELKKLGLGNCVAAPVASSATHNVQFSIA